MTREELEALRDSNEVRTFIARWNRMGSAYSEGCRGVVEAIGFPAAPHAVLIRDNGGDLHRWDMRHLTTI